LQPPVPAPVTLETSSTVWAPALIASFILDLGIALQIQTFVSLSRTCWFKLFF